MLDLKLVSNMLRVRILKNKAHSEVYEVHLDSGMMASWFPGILEGSMKPGSQEIRKLPG